MRSSSISGVIWQPLRLTLSVAILAYATHASAGIFADDEARRAILDVRQKVEELRVDSDRKLTEEVRRSTEDVAQMRRALVDLQSQLDASRAEIAKMRGQGEQLARDLADVQRRYKDVVQAMDERLRKFEPARVTVDGQEFMAENGEQRDYDAALALFRKGDFGAAQVSLVDFLNRYPTTGYRATSLFWLGNAQYATKDYKDALASFRALVNMAPNHIRVPETMLAIANCQLEMKEVKSARRTLEELIGNHPGTEAAAAAKDRLGRFK